MALQGVLQRMSTGIDDPFDPDLYFVSVFGTPGARAWGWRLEGHHLSRHFTVVGDTLVTEPFFLGAWPTRAGSAYRSVGQGYRTMAREEDAAREIVLSLDGRLRRQVVFSSESLTDHVTQNAVRVRPLDRVGVSTRDLPSAAQTTGARDRAHLPREPPTGDGPRGVRADRASGHGPHALRLGRQHSPRRSRTTTACKDRPSSSSSTTPGTAARTSTASGATSSATSAATCCRPLGGNRRFRRRFEASVRAMIAAVRRTVAGQLPRTLLVAAWLALVAAPGAAADLADETALAERFAPVVRLVEQEEECGPGEPYDPLDVELLLDDEPTVALRGPWSPTDLVKIGPSGEDLRNRFEYHLDFPGDALDRRLRLRALDAPPRGGERADRLRARRHGSRSARTSSRSSTGSSTRSTTSTTRTRATGS